MTIIVGLLDKENKTIYMGGDSAGVGGYSLMQRRDAKVFINGDFIIGYTTSFRMGQLLRFKFVPPKLPDGMDVYKFMCTDFIDSVRLVLKEGGFATVNDNVEAGGTFLVGFKGRLFEVQDDFQVAEGLINYAACGCGEDIALGSLYSTTHLIRTPEERVMIALKAAGKFSAGVCDPFIIEKLKYETEIG